jgi:16S rRNA (uracil1498-N3)-methyltransferase
MSTPPLFLVDELPRDDRFPLTGDEGRHAARVKRLGSGERVLVGDGRGTVLECVVADVLADGLALSVESRRVEPAPSPRLVVVQALPKGDRAELAVEVLTELGVDEIVPWAASRSVAQWHGPRGDKALAKWRRTAAEAAKQSRRAWVPGVAPLARTADVAARIAASTGLVLHEAATEPLTAAALPAIGDVLVVVGPEGGIADDELAAFIAAGAASVRMGAPVLRTSTAGAAALAVLSARLGRWA